MLQVGYSSLRIFSSHSEVCVQLSVRPSPAQLHDRFHDRDDKVRLEVVKAVCEAAADNLKAVPQLVSGVQHCWTACIHHRPTYIVAPGVRTGLVLYCCVVILCKLQLLQKLLLIVFVQLLDDLQERMRDKVVSACVHLNVVQN